MKNPTRRALAGCAVLALGLASAQDAAVRGDDVKPAEDVAGKVGIDAFHTYSQRAWGDMCMGTDAPSCWRDTHFAALFPMGLVIGDTDGLDTDDAHALVFETPEALGEFLPLADDADVTSLQQSLTNPAPTERGLGGAMTGELIAAKLNVAFDQRGLMPTSMERTALSELVYIDGVTPSLVGRSVGDIIRLADDAIAGVHGPFANSAAVATKSLDTDDDGTGDTSLHDVHIALALLNGNFANGKTNAGHLAVPVERLADKLEKQRRARADTADAESDTDGTPEDDSDTDDGGGRR